MRLDPDPVGQLRIFVEELKARKLLAPICLASMADNGFPNSRFVDLKEVRNGRFLFGTDGRSVKARELGRDNKVSFAAWWEPLQVQVRVQGTVSISEGAVSDRIFAERSRSAQALAIASIQSAELKDPEVLNQAISGLVDGEQDLSRPLYWNVYEITPVTIEILRFSKDRIHERTRYVIGAIGWNPTRLNP